MREIPPAFSEQAPPVSLSSSTGEQRRRQGRGASGTPVLFVEVSTYPSYGGTKRVLVNLMHGLDRARFSPRVLVYRDGPWVDDLRALDVPVAIYDASPGVRTPFSPAAANEQEPATSTPVAAAGMARGHRSPLRRAAWEVRSWWHLHGRDVAAAERLIRFVPADTRLIDVNHSLVGDGSWFHVARKLGLPFVAHEHGLWRPRSSAYRHTARHAASVICLTEERRRQVRTLLGPRVSAECVPNGVPTSQLQPCRSREAVRAELNVAHGFTLVITAGHLQTWKGQLLAVEAAAVLAARGVDFQWLLCGAEVEPAYVARIRRRIAEAGLGERVRLLGERFDLPDLFAASDVAVHTSIEPEPFGLVVVEAMLQRLPVVGPREGSLPSIVRDGVDGVLVRPRDADDLAGAIAKLVGDRGRREAMGRSGRQRVLDSFDTDAMARRLEAVYDRALAVKA